MILVQPDFYILSFPSYPERITEAAGRVCYKSEDKITTDSAKAFVARLLKSGHHSVLEHASATVHITTNRGVTHELVRHRIASYSQESTRYVDYDKHIKFVIPTWLSVPTGLYDSDHFLLKRPSEAYEQQFAAWLWLKSCKESEDSYHDLRAFGWRPEQARDVLNNSLKTEIVVTANMREWLHIFTLRTSKAAHPEIRQIMTKVLWEFADRYPTMFRPLWKDDK